MNFLFLSVTFGALAYVVQFFVRDRGNYRLALRHGGCPTGSGESESVFSAEYPATLPTTTVTTYFWNRSWTSTHMVSEA